MRDAQANRIIRNIILNTQKWEKKKKKHYVGSGPKVLSQLTRCVMYIQRDEWLGCNTEADCIIRDIILNKTE